MSDDLRCTNCGEYAGSPIADRIEELQSERDHYVNKLMEACNSYTDMHLRIEELEVNLAKAVAELEGLGFDSQSILGCELKGQDDG